MHVLRNLDVIRRVRAGGCQASPGFIAVPAKSVRTASSGPGPRTDRRIRGQSIRVIVGLSLSHRRDASSSVTPHAPSPHICSASRPGERSEELPRGRPRPERAQHRALARPSRAQQAAPEPVIRFVPSQVAQRARGGLDGEQTLRGAEAEDVQSKLVWQRCVHNMIAPRLGGAL